MKVISIIQPWATLIDLGEKKFETRSWKTTYRGELGIHSSNKVDKHSFYYPPILTILNKHNIHSPKDLPLGKIIATSQLTDCLRVRFDLEDYALLEDNMRIKGQEYYLGWYAKGRYAWKLNDIKYLANPIDVKGKLRLWEYNE